MNKVILVGNLGADPELRFTQGDQAVLNVRMATTETWVDRDGAKKERTDWHNVTIWGKRGEALAKILVKGSKLLIEGRIQTSSYEDKNGEKRYKTEINATNVELLGGRPNGERDDDRGRDNGGRDNGGRSNGDDRSRREPPRDNGDSRRDNGDSRRDARRDDRDRGRDRGRDNGDRRPQPADDFAAPGGDADLPF
jgi:single-strand DNA-binding protein